MARLRIPQALIHRATGQLYVNYCSERLYFGKADRPESQERYKAWLQRLLVEVPLAVPGRPSVDGVTAEFHKYACLYYAGQYPDDPEPEDEEGKSEWILRQMDRGAATNEVQAFEAVIRLLRRICGGMAVNDLRPRHIHAWLEAAIAQGWVRSNINRQLIRLKRIIRWGVSHELIPPSVHQAVITVEGLRAGRSRAKESKRVRAIAMERVAMIEPHVSRQVWALVQLQLHSGARPGELVGLRPCDLDRHSDPWEAVLEKHKNAHRDQPRILLFNHAAQRVLMPYLMRPQEAPMFQPYEALHDFLADKTAGRVTPAGYGNCSSGKIRMCVPGEAFTVNVYRRAIARGCERAYAMPAELKDAYGDTPEQRKAKQERRKLWHAENVWHPHQLRHTAATRLRRELGVEMARVVLGHATLDATEIYAEADLAKARSVMEAMG